MKKFLKLLILLSFSHTAFSKKFVVDPSNSKIGFSVMKFKIENAVVGNFKTYSGTYDFDPKTMILKDVNVTIEASSINTNEEKRDAHLKKDPAFFNVKKHKSITFKSLMPIKLKLEKMVVVPGLLKIKDVEKKISLLVMFNGTKANKPAKSAEKPSFVASANINRHDFKVSWNQDLDKKKDKSLIDRLKTKFKQFAGKILGDNVKVNVVF